MSRTLLIRGVAILVVVASLAAIAFQLRSDEQPQFPRPSDAELMLQAEHDGMRFLAHFDGGGWRGFPPAARAVWATVRFEIQATAFNGAGLAAAPGPLDPTVDELVAAYRELGVPQAEPVLADYGRLRSGPSPTAQDWADWRSRFQALSGRIAEARRTYLAAHLGEVAAAMAR
jgi:hypothetical protein